MPGYLWRNLEDSARDIKKALKRETLPPVLVILGSGFKGFEYNLTDVDDLDVSGISHFPVPAVEGHGSRLVVGKIGGRDVAVMTGRVHMYEGRSPEETVYPLRVLATLGVQSVLLTNAAGSVRPEIKPGTIVALSDHINLTAQSCLASAGARELGQVFVDMSAVYDKAWRAAILQAGGIAEGVYAGVLGPSYETPAETRMLGILGASVVGMSTVQEAIAARHMNLKVAGLSFVTNMAGGLGGELTHAEVIELAQKHKSRLHDVLAHAIGVAP